MPMEVSITKCSAVSSIREAAGTVPVHDVSKSETGGLAEI